MFSTLILARSRIAFAAAVALVFLGACQKVPLLAPSGSTITLTSAATVLPVNGSATIIGQLIEASGSPPHSGTLVTFTTTLGSIEPSQARTDVNGQVAVAFHAGNQSGTATITATSGAANVGTNGAVKVAIGSAAVGRVNVSASPTSVPAFGGTSTITASVLDINGNPLSSVPVTFVSTAGSLADATKTTDSSGVARTTLTTTQQSTVTASVGAQGTTGGGTGTTPPSTGGTGSTTPTAGQASGTVTVTVLNAPTIVITQPTTAPSAGLPSTYTFAVTAASSNGSAVRDVTVNWGDGRIQDLGAISGSVPVSHIYDTAGSYVITATLQDVSGNVINVGSPVSVIQTALPTVVVTATSIPSVHSQFMPVTFQIQVTTPTGVTIQSGKIEWGDGQVNEQVINGTITVQHTYAPTGTGQSFTVKVTVTDSLGRTPFGSTTITLP